jgi:hypothetical protein
VRYHLLQFLALHGLVHFIDFSSGGKSQEKRDAEEYARRALEFVGLQLAKRGPFPPRPPVSDFCAAVPQRLRIPGAPAPLGELEAGLRRRLDATQQLRRSSRRRV